MNEFFQRLAKPGPKAPSQIQRDRATGSTGISRDVLDGNTSRSASAAWHRPPQSTLPGDEDVSVSTLRTVYSSLLEDMAPLHHARGSSSSRGGPGGEGDANFRWKNAGTISVRGSEEEGGYDYSYEADDSRKSWRLRLGHARPGPGDGGRGGGGVVVGVTGGDWSRDGIRRYHTGGALADARGGGGGGRSDRVLHVGGMAVDVGTMNGVEISPEKQSAGAAGGGAGGGGGGDGDAEDEDTTSGVILFDGEEDAPDAQTSSSFMEDVVLGEAPQGHADKLAVFESEDDDVPTQISLDPSPPPPQPPPPTLFESLYHLTPLLVWRLRAAHAPRSPEEQHLLLSHGSLELLAQRRPDQAAGIRRGLAAADEVERRVCAGLARLGRLVGSGERRRGRGGQSKQQEETGKETNQEDEDVELEAAEAMFAYFCEKNILPMLIDSLLCLPPPLTSSEETANHKTTTISATHSTFSGACWTPSVKAQILQIIAMILFNTSLPLSVTYLLSNNYMNELIMGVLPLTQWKEDSLEEILPAYVTLLRGLIMRLRSSEECGGKRQGCLQLLLCQRSKRKRLHSGNHAGQTTTLKGALPPPQDGNEEAATESYLPLFYAAVHVFCSTPHSTSLRDSEGCLIRTTAMNVILNLCRTTDPEVRWVLVQGGRKRGPVKEGHFVESSDVVPDHEWLPTTKSTPLEVPSQSLLSHPLTVEQEMLFMHICESLNSWFYRSVRLAMASLSIDGKSNHHNTQPPSSEHQHHDEARAEAKARHKDLAVIQFQELQYWLGFIDDLLSCEMQWNVRLVEWLLREVIVGLLMRWDSSLKLVPSRTSGDKQPKFSTEVCKAKAVVRVSIVFLTQLFGMIEYSPLLRLVGALVLHPKYPCAWSCLEKDDKTIGQVDFSQEGLFVVTSTINDMIKESMLASNNAKETISDSQSKEEADVGAGERPTAAISNDIVAAAQQDPEKETQGKRTPSSDCVNKIDDHNSHHLADDHERTYSGSHNQYAANHHRAALLTTLAGGEDGCHSCSFDETMLASMLLATILENDAIDDRALELFSVLPSPKGSIQLSPFELSIAQYISQDWSTIDPSNYPLAIRTIECVSSLGMMLLERTVFHTWTEGGQCTEIVPFDHYYKSSKFVQALGTSLSHFALEVLASDINSNREAFSDLIRQRYSSSDVPDSPRSNEESTRMFCSLQNYYPSNLIDNASVLAGEMECKESSPFTMDRSLFNEQDKASKFSIQLTLHLQSLVGCVQDLYKRSTSSNKPHSTSNSRWSGKGESLSFLTTEEADEILLSIAGYRKDCPPKVGMIADLRGRKTFRCSLPRKSNAGRGNVKWDIRIVAKEKCNLVLIVDPSEVCVTEATKEDPNKCTVLAVVPLRSIIASATEGELFHIVTKEKTVGLHDEILKNGTLSLRFDNSGTCKATKECLDKYLQAYEKKIVMGIIDWLEKCSLMGADNSSHSEVVEDSWSEFESP